MEGLSGSSASSKEFAFFEKNLTLEQICNTLKLEQPLKMSNSSGSKSEK